MRIIAVSCVMVALLPASTPAQETAGDPGLESVGWLAGCWELRSGDRVTIEMWMPPAGGLMLGSARTVAGETLREYEQVMLRVVEGAVVYTARPSGQAEASSFDNAATSLRDGERLKAQFAAIRGERAGPEFRKAAKLFPISPDFRSSGRGRAGFARGPRLQYSWWQFMSLSS